MAADSLVAAAKKAGATLHVETQGSSGSTPLDASTIAAADAVIFATDVGVKDKHRFAGKPVVASGVKRAINEPDKMVAEALAAADNPNAARVDGGAGPSAPSAAPAGGVGWGTRTRQILLTGVSYMIPFVAAGGLLIALGFLFGGYEIANSPDGEKPSLPYGFGSIGHVIASTNSLTNLPSGGLIEYLGAVLFTLGGLAFMFLVPALAGYISFAIADRPGIAPGFTAGAVAVFVGGGFIGGIVGGLIAGFTALWISRIATPRWLRGLMPVVVIPLFASLAVGLLMFLLLGRPLAAITSGLTNWLGGMSGSSVHHPRRDPRPDDVLRPRWPGQQGRLRVRHRGAQCRRPGVAAHHGRGDGRGHGATRWRWPSPSTVRPGCSPSRSGKTAGPLGFSVRRSSPREPSRSPRPIRCG